MRVACLCLLHVALIVALLRAEAGRPRTVASLDAQRSGAAAARTAAKRAKESTHLSAASGAAKQDSAEVAAAAKAKEDRSFATGSAGRATLTPLGM
jgi:hypothetical protein